MRNYKSVMKFGAVALALGLTLGVAACSDDDDGGDSTGSTTTSATTSATTTGDETGTTTEGTTTGATTAEGETVEVTAIDYEFEGLPETVEAGTVFTLTNTSDAELHEMTAILLPETETRSAEELLALPEEELGELAAIEPSFVLIAPPGEDGMPVLGDGTLTEPGRYLILCAIPVGADPEELMSESTGAEAPEVQGGPPHFTEGMFGEVTVE